MDSSIFIGCTLILSAFTFSFAGFGFGLVAVPLLSLVLPVKEAVAIQLPFSVLLVVVNSCRYGRLVKWGELKPLFIGSAAAIPAGVYALHLLPDTLMKSALALFVVVVVLFDRTRRGQAKLGQFSRTGQGGVILGMISGWFTGAYTTGGPPVVIYATARFPEPRKAKGAMGLYFMATGVLIAVLFIQAGLLTEDLLLYSLRFTPAVLLGFLFGARVFKNMTRETYLIGVHLLLLIAAVMLCL